MTTIIFNYFELFTGTLTVRANYFSVTMELFRVCKATIDASIFRVMSNDDDDIFIIWLPLLVDLPKFHGRGKILFTPIRNRASPASDLRLLFSY